MALRTKNKPVLPTAPSHHGFFGVPYFKAHVMTDPRWEPSCLTNQFKCMAHVMEKHFHYKRHENAAFKKRYLKQNRELKQECRDGRQKLQMALHASNSKKIRNYLMNYKDMQRLYHAMPIHLVVDNINQRTFVLRKERDRLRYRLGQLLAVYEKKLIEKASLENRIKYQNEFILDEEIAAKKIRNKIECSNVRLNAIKTINDAYKKIIQLLLHDEIYYEPILRSLQKDIDDQAHFMGYIIELGLPAISRLHEITEQHRKLEDKVRRNIAAKQRWIQNYKREAQERQADLRKLQAKGDENVNYLKRYVRETRSMLELKWDLESLEIMIKQVKFATLCSKVTEVYPRIKKQIRDNERLRKVLEADKITHEYTEKKLQRAEVMRGILEHNLSKEELTRVARIKELEEAITEERNTHGKSVKYLRERARIFLMIRYALWNFNEIMRYIIRQGKINRREYPTTELKLPLLKFENLMLRAFPPEVYEENIDNLLQYFKTKVATVMAIYKEHIPTEEAQQYEKEYHEQFVARLDPDEYWSEKESEGGEEDDTQERKIHLNVPTRAQLKQVSAKIVEELSKKDD